MAVIFALAHVLVGEPVPLAGTCARLDAEVSGMDGLVIHASFDVLAWIAAGAAALWLSRTGRVSFPVRNRCV